MTFKTTLNISSRILRSTAKAYLLAHSSAAFITYLHSFNTDQYHQETPINGHLFCDINISSSQGMLTLLGENHLYTSNESATAQEMLGNYNFILYEGCGNQCRAEPSSKEITAANAAFLLRYVFIYYAWGSGRSEENPTFLDFAHYSNIDVDFLEEPTNGGFDIIPQKEFDSLLHEALLDTIIAPYYYFVGLRETSNYIPGIYETSTKPEQWGITERNILMADQIRRKMEEYGPNKYLAVVGRAHFSGMTQLLGGCKEEYFTIIQK